MPIKPFYNEILTDHNLYPSHKKELPDANLTLRGVNPSCGDRITLQLRVNEAGMIEDGTYTGDGCAISQASADMMLDLIIGRDRETALHLCSLFMKMIRDAVTDSELEELEEAAALKDISHMPSRVKCAVLGWRTMAEILRPAESDSVLPCTIE